LEIIMNVYGSEKIDELKKILASRINEVEVEICDECGLLEVYCPICEAYHHVDSFTIEHLDHQK